MYRASLGTAGLPRERTLGINSAVVYRGQRSNNGAGWTRNDVIQATRKGRSKVSNWYAPKDLNKGFLGWGPGQINEIKQIGLGGVLEIDLIPTTNRDYCQWLFQRVDVSKSCLRIGISETVPLDEITVSRVLGTRYGGRVQIKRDHGQPSADSILHARRNLGLPDSIEEVTVKELISVLNKSCSEPMTDAEKIWTRVGFVMLCCAVFFSARGKRGYVPCEAYEIVKDHHLLREVNWGRYVLDEIIECASAVQYAIRTKKQRFAISGCMHFLQILYFDSVETGFFKVDPNLLPRIAFYTAAGLKALIDEDTWEEAGVKKYGLMPAKTAIDNQLPESCAVQLVADKIAETIIEKNRIFGAMIDDMNCVFYTRLPGEPARTLNEIHMHQRQRADMRARHKTKMSELIYSSQLVKHVGDIKSMLSKLELLVEGDASVAVDSLRRLAGAAPDVCNDPGTSEGGVDISHAFAEQYRNDITDLVPIANADAFLQSNISELCPEKETVLAAPLSSDCVAEVLGSMATQAGAMNDVVKSRRIGKRASVMSIYNAIKGISNTSGIRNSSDLNGYSTPTLQIPGIGVQAGPVSSFHDFPISGYKIPLEKKFSALRWKRRDSLQSIQQCYILYYSAKRVLFLDAHMDINKRKHRKVIVRKSSLSLSRGQSPFDAGLYYNYVDRGRAELAYQNLIDCPLKDKHSVWIMHLVPDLRKVKGGKLLDLLNHRGSLDYCGFDLVGRVMMTQDGKWTNFQDRTRWRHPIHPMFTGAVFHSTNCWTKRQIYDLFVGEKIDYDVETCRMLYAPYVDNDGVWVLYALDMEMKKINVFDPFRAWQGIEILAPHHDSKCTVLLDALSKCYENFFMGYEIKPGEWKFHYFDGFSPYVKRRDTSFCIVHCMFYFNGVTITKDLDQDGVHVLKTQLLQFFTKLEGNMAKVPPFITLEI